MMKAENGTSTKTHAWPIDSNQPNSFLYSRVIISPYAEKIKGEKTKKENIFKSFLKGKNNTLSSQ